MNIILVKESQASETRVALIPFHVKQLIQAGHAIFVEHDAGQSAGFSDQDYQEVGAEVRYLNSQSIEGFKQLFENMDMIVRVKRPDRAREILENHPWSNILMVGVLDIVPHENEESKNSEKNSPHLDEYRKANIHIISLDQLPVDQEDPMNIFNANNTSEYLKAMPNEASQLWSNAVFHFIIKVSQLFQRR